MNIDEAALKAERAHVDTEAVTEGGGTDYRVIVRIGKLKLHGLWTSNETRCEQEAATVRALLHRSQPVAVVPAEQAEDSAMLDWLEREHFSLSAIKEPCGDDQFALWWQVTQGRKSISGHPLASPREAIRAAIGRNREAGGS